MDTMPATQPTQALQQHQNIAFNSNATAPLQDQVMPEKPSLQNFPLMTRSDTLRKKPKKTVEVPMFLRKTFHMVNASDPSIVCWSKDGKSFIIKDVDKFSSTIIPQFFNHKNFKSFVRQLNFYGFHKVKNDRIKKDAAQDKLEAKFWRFRHDHFRKGRPDLLEEIQKSKHNAVASQEEVDSLKDEIKDLKSCIAVMATNFEKLNSFIDTEAAQKPSTTAETEYDPSAPRKRRRIETDAAPSSLSTSSNHATDARVQQSAIPPRPVYRHQVTPLNDAYKPGTIMPVKKTDRMASFGSIGSLNQDFLELFDGDFDDDEEENIEKVAPVVALSSTQVKTNPDQDQELWSKLHESFAALPKEAQEFLVKHLDEAVASPNNLRYLIDISSMSFNNEKDEMRVTGDYSIPSVVPPES